MWLAVVIGAGLGVLSVLFRLIFRRQTDLKATSRLGVVKLSEIEAVLLLADPSEHQALVMHVFRQSGNLERSIECQGRDVALHEVTKLFNRMREDKVRIWENNANSADVRRPYGSFRGRSEGRKIWGCKLEVIPLSSIA